MSGSAAGFACGRGIKEDRQSEGLPQKPGTKVAGTSGLPSGELPFYGKDRKTSALKKNRALRRTGRRKKRIARPATRVLADFNDLKTEIVHSPSEFVVGNGIGNFDFGLAGSKINRNVGNAGNAPQSLFHVGGAVTAAHAFNDDDFLHGNLSLFRTASRLFRHLFDLCILYSYEYLISKNVLFRYIVP